MPNQAQLAFVRRATRALRYVFKPGTLDPAKTSTTGMVSAVLGELSMAFFHVSGDRMDVYTDAEEMDDTVDEVSTALDILADNAVNAEDGTQGAFTVVVEGGPSNVNGIIKETLDQVRWREKAFAIARDTLWYGDTFLQNVIDEGLRLVRLMYMPPKSMFRNEDQFGLLLTGTKQGEAAFEQYMPGTTQRIAWWYPWQIEHIRWGRSGGKKYGRSLLHTARTPWKKWQAMEEALVINWLTRAFARLCFTLDVTGKTDAEAEAAIKKFAESLSTREIASGVKGEEELSVVKDIYIGRAMHEIGGRAYPGGTDVKVLDTSNTGFWNLGAIEYYQNKVLTSLRVPKAHLGLERDINAKATLQQQDRHFARTIRRVQSMLSEAIEHTIRLQLALLEVDVSGMDIKILWPSPSWADMLDESSALSNFADADEKLLAMGAIDVKYIRAKQLKMTQAEVDAPVQPQVAPSGRRRGEGEE